MEQTVVGVFDTAADASRARDELLRSGFTDAEVQVQSHDREAFSGRTDDGEDEGFMASVSRFFSGLFGAEDEHAGHYSEAVRRGGSVVAVTLQDETRIAAARSILSNAGAVDIERRAAAWREEGYSRFDEAAPAYDAQQVSAERERVLPVVREELVVGKREEDLGTVRVHSRIVEKPVQEVVQLREEHAEVERRSVDRPVTEGDLTAFKEGTIELRETAERAVVGKSARVVEEVVVGTRTSTSSQTINETLRNTEVEVEKAGSVQKTGASGSAAAATSSDSSLYRTHFDSTFASTGAKFQDYEPAYSYGSELRSDSRYAGRQWADVEGDARTEWTTRNPGSDWSRYSAAVQHGWTKGRG